MKRAFAWLLALLVAAGAAFANDAKPLADDPVTEKRLIAISEELRCLVCQNESLAGSRADLAEDLRREVRNLIRQGKSDAEIMDFLTSRYGDFVRYRPPFKPLTWLLWIGPFVLLGVGAWVLARRVRASHGTAETPPALDEAQREQARRLLQESETDPRP